MTPIPCPKHPGRKVICRGMCRVCYDAIKNVERRRGGPDKGEKMTTEEVEALVQAQMQCLPPWWEDDTRMMEQRAGRRDWVRGD